MFSFNIILTEKCNAKCSHCYMGNETAPALKSLSTKQINEIVDKIPSNTKNIVLTGGEVFLEKNLLEFAIKKFHSKFPNAVIGVESNGIVFYKNTSKAIEILEKLKEEGVSFIRFSYDIFHEQGGVDLSKVYKLKELESNKTPKIKFLVQETALAIGRAEKLPDDKKAKMNCMNSLNSLKNPYLFLDIDGNIYTCAWKCSPVLANIFKDDWKAVLQALKDPIQKHILSGNIEKATELVCKDNSKNIEYAKKNGQCMLCYKIFKNSKN